MSKKTVNQKKVVGQQQIYKQTARINLYVRILVTIFLATISRGNIVINILPNETLLGMDFCCSKRAIYGMYKMFVIRPEQKEEIVVTTVFDVFSVCNSCYQHILTLFQKQ